MLWRGQRMERDTARVKAFAVWNAAAGLLLCASLWVIWSRLCYRAREG
jgi:hypothetical protein